MCTFLMWHPHRLLPSRCEDDRQAGETGLHEGSIELGGQVCSEQHEAAQVAVSSGTPTPEIVSSGSLVVDESASQHEAAQGATPGPAAGIETVWVVDVVGSPHGVGQQSSGPAKAANEISASPLSPMIVGASR